MCMSHVMIHAHASHGVPEGGRSVLCWNPTNVAYLWHFGMGGFPTDLALGHLGPPRKVEGRRHPRAIMGQINLPAIRQRNRLTDRQSQSIATRFRVP